MKKNKKVSVLLTALLLIVSCNTDDGVEGIPPPNFEVLGLWDLVEVNVNPAQDLNMDGTASTNLMDELDCLSGTLLIDGDLVWTFEQSNLDITSITSGQFNVGCADTNSATGTWFSDENEVTFDGDDALTALKISGDQLVNEVGEDLPGIQSFAYVRRVVN